MDTLSYPIKKIFMTQKSMNELLKSIQTTFEQQKFSDLTTRNYFREFRRIQDYMNQNNLILYDESIGENYLNSMVLKDNLSKNVLSSINRTLCLLNDKVNDVPLRKKRIALKTYPLNGELGIHAETFIKQFRDEIRPAQQTLKTYIIALSHFTVRMEMDNIGLKELSDTVILRFFSSLQNLRERVCVPVRRFLRYLYLGKLIEKDLSVYLFSMKDHRAEKVPSFYTNDEIRKMDEAIERNSPVGKRNYAMFLLASRLGMRSSDIRNLQFRDIDWERNVITFQQIKTAKVIELPLYTNIGESIIDYIHKGRPQSSDKTVFLSATVPYTPITATAFSSIISNIIYKAGIETKGRHHGSHCLRHSLATSLLKQGTSLPVISETLGHSNTESTMIYLNVDVEGLLRCSLNVPPVSEQFYNQKGGMFYV